MLEASKYFVSEKARKGSGAAVGHRHKREVEERTQQLWKKTTLYSVVGKRVEFLLALPSNVTNVGMGFGWMSTTAEMYYNVRKIGYLCTDVRCL